MFGTKSDDGYTEIIKGIKIKTVVYGKETLMTEFIMKKDSILTEHKHVHEQTGYLVDGKIKLYIHNGSRIMHKGESWCVPSNVLHKADILEDSIAIEVFSPVREEYKQYSNIADVID